MNILVTGGAGFIGSNLTERLVSDDHNVTVLDNLHTGSVDNLKKIENKIRLIKDTSQNINKIAPKNLDAIFHFGIPSSTPMYRANPYLVGDAINSALAIYEYAKKNGVKKIVIAGSSSVYNEQPPPHREDMPVKVTDYYTEARLTIERLAELYSRLYGINSISLRFFSVYGPHEEAKKQYANMLTQFTWSFKKHEEPVIYGDGTQTRDLTYVKDTVNACIIALNAKIQYDIFNVGTGKTYTFNQLIEILNRKMNMTIKPKYIPNPLKGYVAHTLADTHKAEEKLGFKAKYALEDGIQELLSYNK